MILIANKKGEYFDLLVILFSIVIFEINISFTIVARYILLFALLLFVIISKIFLNEEKLLKKLLFQSGQALGYSVIILSLLPILTSLLHQESPIFAQFPWYTPSNSWIILLAFCFSNFFIGTADRLKTSNQSFLAKESFNLAICSLFIGLLIENIYSICKITNVAILPSARWKGSAGNPQLWAIEIAIYLLLWLVSHKSLNEFFKSKWCTRIILIIIILDSIASQSISNLLGLAFASLAFLLPHPVAALITCGTAILLFHLITLFTLTQDHNSLFAFTKQLGPFTKKFLPRLKIWVSMFNQIKNIDVNPFIGLGYKDYLHLVQNLTKEQPAVNVHNLYLHFWYSSGLLGLYNLAALLINAFSFVINNKYLLAIVLYVMGHGFSDCGILYPEIIQVFWLTLPLIIYLTRPVKSV